jgi:beta-lactamase regulating signal transducer with metallopeptidase domain
MMHLENIFNSNIIEATSWALIHSLWQAAAIAFLLWSIMAILHKATSSKRYYFSVLALLLVLLSFAFTFLQYFEPSKAEAQAAGMPMSDLILALPQIFLAQNLPVNFQSNLFSYFESNIHWVFSIWFVGIAIFSLRFMGGFFYTQRLKRHATFQLPEQIEDKAHQLAEKINLKKRIRISGSNLVNVPLVVGHFRAAILLPVSIVSSMPLNQIEVILIHELAHIKRHDNLINLIQRLVEILFFFHPAVWWISSMIRSERESACDEVALSVYPDKLNYAKTLANLEEFKQKIPVYAAAFTGTKYNLLNRLKRLTMNKQNANNYVTGLLASMLILGTFVVLSASGGIPNFAGESQVPEKFDVKAKMEMDAINIEKVLPDTTVKKEKKSVVVKTRNAKSDGKAIEVKSRNGKIVEYIVDGKKLKPEDFPKDKGLKISEGVLIVSDGDEEAELELVTQKLKKLEKELVKNMQKQHEEERELIKTQLKLNDEQKKELVNVYKLKQINRTEEIQQKIKEINRIRKEQYKNYYQNKYKNIKVLGQDSMYVISAGMIDDIDVIVDMAEIHESPRMVVFPENYVFPELPELPEQIEAFDYFKFDGDSALYYEKDGYKDVWIMDDSRDFFKYKTKRNGDDDKQFFTILTDKHQGKNYFVKKRLKEELIEDGLISNYDHSIIEISKNKLFIEGKKQPRKYAKKYTKLYEALSGNELDESILVELN